MALEKLLRALADGEYHSGQELGDRLGVSRNAVWKQLKKLPELGVDCYSIKGRGYRIPGGLDLLEQARIREYLQPEVQQQLSALKIELVMDSTNARALAASQEQDSHGALFVAERQTAGRGRRGRTWHSPFASNLYFSLVWGFSGGAAALEGLSLVVGLAMVEGLSACGLNDVKLKWPNDLLWQDRKLGGILLEMTGDASGQCQVVIGVGLNVAMPASGEAEIDQPWTDIQSMLTQAAVKKPLTRSRLLAELLNALVPMIERFEAKGFAAFRSAWQVSDAYRGAAVRLATPSMQIDGVCQGVDDSGALLLQTDAGIKAFHGGEISVRKRS